MSYRIVVPVEGSGGFINGVTVDAWKVSRFANANVPAKDSSPPSGSPDAGPVTTATNGAPGQAILDVPVGFVYNIRVQQGGNAYWTQTSEALGGLATTALQSFQGRTTTAATLTKSDVTGTGLTYSDIGADASGAAATVQGNLNTEASTRASADTTLQTNINTEASTRASADTTNATAISTEATTRGNADTTLQANIDAEAASRVAGDALAVKKASNLSDLANAATARTNLGLDTAATHPASDFSGSAAGTAGKPLAATDASVTNPRTPTAHASTHANAGSDPVTIAESQVTNLVTDLAAKAPLASPALTGSPTAPTQTAGDNSTKIATTAYADLKVAKAGDTMSGALAMGSNKITGLANGTAATDAVALGQLPSVPTSANQGLLAATFADMATASGTVTLTAGVQYFFMVNVTAPITATKFTFRVNAAASGLTHGFLGLYTQAGALISGSTTADTTTFTAATGYSIPLGTPQTLSVGIYYVGIMFSGTTPPTLVGVTAGGLFLGSTVSSGTLAGGSRALTNGTGLTALLSSVSGTPALVNTLVAVGIV